MPALECASCGKAITAADLSREQSALCPHCGQRLLLRPVAAGIGNAPLTGAVEALPHDREAPSGSAAAATPDAAADYATLHLPPGGSGPAAFFPSLSPPREPGELGWLAHYRVVKLLGQGGMGTVFMAEDTDLQRPVALKLMDPEMAQDLAARQRFLREARATAAIKSDHIVTIHQVGQENATPYLAMELLQGVPLDRWLEQNRRPSLPQVLDLGLQIAKGLAAAHERGLIHRDIKPGNIWVELPSGRVKILDFGLARPTQDDAHLTQTGIVVGTPAYMAPEQADGAPVDARCDVFSLGCVLYELAAGEPPFLGSTTIAILKAVALTDPRPLHEVNPAIPAPLSDLVNRLLAKNPTDRPASGQEVVEALSAIAAAHTGTRTALRSGASLKCPPGVPGGRPRGRAFALLGLVGLLGLAVLLGIWLARDGVLPSRQAEGPMDSGQKKSRPHPSIAQGVTDDEIRVGMSAPFSGDARELGRDMQLGIDTYFRSVNDRGGVDGRKLTLVALDDGYDPDRALANMKELNEQRKVFAVLGNVGTPTALKTVPYAVEHKLLFFGPFTGAKALRKVPPARYVFNYRASYEEETAKILEYLIRVKKVRPEQVAVFAQNDSYGQDGFDGVVRVLRKHGRDRDQVLHVTYERGSTDVDAAVQKVLAHKDAIRAVVMVATYRPAARFIEKVKDARADMIFTNVSFVGSQALAEELGPKYRDGLIVTQVVPPLDCDSTAVLKFREQLRTYFPNERPSFVALEGYIAAAVFAEGLRRVGGDLTTEQLINVLESIRDLDLGTGAAIHYGASEHQGSHKVWGTLLDAAGAFKEIDLDE